MKQPYSIVIALLLALRVIAQAQDSPPPSAAPPQSEMQMWIATTDAQWQAVCKRDVSDVHLTELEKLKQQYVALLEAAVTKASGAGDLDGAVALRNEEKRFAGTNLFPEQDDAADGASVKQIRAAIRTQIARLDKDSAARTRALHAKYDQVLAQAQTQLTQRQRLEDALLVKAKREEVAAAWLAGVPAAPSPAVAVEQPKPPVPSGRSPAITNPAAPPNLPVREDTATAAVKAVIAGSRWHWFDSPDFSGKAYWVEFYKDGTARTSWQKGHTWDLQPPNILHVFQPSDKRQWYFDIDVAKRTGLKNAEKDRNHNSIRFEKHISGPTADVKKKK